MFRRLDSKTSKVWQICTNSFWSCKLQKRSNIWFSSYFLQIDWQKFWQIKHR